MPIPPTSIVDLSGLAATAAAIARSADARGAHVWVSGGPGSGRSTLARRLGEMGGAILVEPPDVDEPDAVSHAAVQMAVGAGVAIPDESSTFEIV